VHVRLKSRRETGEADDAPGSAGGDHEEVVAVDALEDDAVAVADG